MAYTTTWNAAFEAAPADTDNISDGATKIRQLKVSISERMGKDHYWNIAGTDADHGEHVKATLRKQTSKPTAEADKGYIYTKVVGDHVELFYENEAGTEIQLTVLGALPTALPAGVTVGGAIVHSGLGTSYQDLGTNHTGDAIEWYNGLRVLMHTAGTGGIFYQSAIDTLARLSLGTANHKLFSNAAGTAPEYGIGLKVLTATRVDNASSGDVSYTGVGFKPSVIIGLSAPPGNIGKVLSIGMTDFSSQGCIYSYGLWSGDNYDFRGYHTTIFLKTNADTGTGGNGQTAVYKTADSDGFTLTWTKRGGGSSDTVGLIFLCIR